MGGQTTSTYQTILDNAYDLMNRSSDIINTIDRPQYNQNKKKYNNKQ